MSERISRLRLAKYAVAAIERGDNLETVLEQIAAYLLETKRSREAILVARSIEDVFAEHGTVVARVTSAHELDDTIHNSIKRLLDTSTLHLTTEIDTSLIGGIHVEAPGKRLDATMKRKVLAFSQMKI